MVRSARTSLPLRAIAIVALALAACGGSSRRASAPTPAAGAPQDTGTPSDGPTSTDGMVTPPAAPTPPTAVTPLTPIVPLTPPAPPAAPAPPPTLVAVELLPATAQVPVGLTLQFSLTGTYSDGSTHDLTAQAAWSSSDAACAPLSTAVGDEGLASGVQAGTTTLRATYGGLDATATLEVTSATLQSIAVSTATPAVALGRAVQFRALGHLSDQTDVDVTTSATWGSDQTSVATISSAPGAHGLATTLSVGTAGVTATLSGLQSAPVTLTVEPAVPDSIAISPAAPLLEAGATVALQAAGVYSDDTTTADVPPTHPQLVATWSSSDDAVATVSGDGVVTAIAPGTATVTASGTLDGVALAGSTAVTVTAAPLAALSYVSVSPSSVRGGHRDPVGTVVLTMAAPAGGAVVELASDSEWATVPASVTVPAGSTSATFTVTTSVPPSATKRTAKTRAVLSATYGGTTRTATLLIRR